MKLVTYYILCAKCYNVCRDKLYCRWYIQEAESMGTDFDRKEAEDIAGNNVVASIDKYRKHEIWIEIKQV